MSERTCLAVQGLCCEAEARMVTGALAGLPGVEQVDVDVVGRRAWVRHGLTVTPRALLAAVEPLGLGASLPAGMAPDGDGASPTHGGAGEEAAGEAHDHRDGEAGFPWRLAGTGALAGVSMLAGWFPPAEYAALVAVGLGLPPVARKGLVALRQRVLDINFLMTIAVVGALGIGEWSEGAAVVFLFAVAEWLEDRAMDRARSAIAAVMRLAPDTATLATGADVPAAGVGVGTRLLIKPGARIPLDGRVASGESSVDESALTGESVPVSKKAGAAVSAGTVNQGGVLEVETTATAGNSAVARMARLVEEAQSARSPTERWVDRFSRIYTPAVCVVAAAVAVVPFAMGEP